MESGDQDAAQIISNWFEGQFFRQKCWAKKDSYNKVVGGMNVTTFLMI